MSARAYSAVPVIAADRPLPEQWADRLVAVRVDTSDAAPAFATLRFRDPGHQLLTGTGIGIGTPLTISAVSVVTRRPVRVFSGEVTGLASEYDDDGTFTVLRAHDQAHRLTQGRRLAVWQGTTVGQVVSDLAGQAALKVGQVTASAAKYPRLVQPNITDWQFLRSLAELHGAVVTVEDGVLSLAPPMPAGLAPDPRQGDGQDPYLLTYGENLLALDVAVDSTGPVGAIQVRGWNADAKEPLVEQAAVAATDQVEIDTTAGDLAKAFTGDGITELVATGYALEDHLAAAAKSFAGFAAAAFAKLEATVTGTPELERRPRGRPGGSRAAVYWAVHRDRGTAPVRAGRQLPHPGIGQLRPAIRRAPGGRPGHGGDPWPGHRHRGRREGARRRPVRRGQGHLPLAGRQVHL